MNCGNSVVFSDGTEQRLQAARFRQTWPQKFIFVGRLVEVKNIRGLIRGYEIYRNLCKNPWPLTIIGDGPLRGELRGLKGVECLGWLEQREIARQMAASAVFVLPSFYEPWGVVAHEATCSGLPLLLSLDVGSGTDLLRDGFNGRLFDAKDPAQLANTLLWFSSHPSLWEMGERSYLLSKQFSPELWSENIRTAIQRIARKHLRMFQSVRLDRTILSLSRESIAFGNQA